MYCVPIYKKKKKRWEKLFVVMDAYDIVVMVSCTYISPNSSSCIH